MKLNSKSGATLAAAAATLFLAGAVVSTGSSRVDRPELTQKGLGGAGPSLLRSRGQNKVGRPRNQG